LTGDAFEPAQPVEHASGGGSQRAGPVHRIPLRWLDFDSQGRVYHAVALSLVDEARSQWFKTHIDDAHADYVIARVEADYHRSIDRSMTHVDIAVDLTDIGSKSMRFDETATGPDGAVLFSSRCWVVMWDRRSARTRSLRAEERLKLKQVLSPGGRATTRKRESP
jgi:acyl-CoA thioesterase FadM